MNKRDKDRSLEIKDFTDMYEVARAYESICFDTYKKAKERDPNNRLVKSMGYSLFKHSKLSPAQLQVLMDLLDK